MSDQNLDHVPKSYGGGSWNILHRRETKYELDVDAAKMLRGVVAKKLGAPYEFKQARPYTFITTIYFDTESLDFYKRATVHYDDSLKIRVKEYYYNLGNGSPIEEFNYCFVEIKHRIGGFVVKRRIKVPKRLLTRLFSGEEIWNLLVAFDPGIEFGDHAHDVYRDLRSYLTRFKIRPTSIINYRRSVFQKREDELRVTFDDDLVIFPPVEGLYETVKCLTRETLGPPTRSIDKVIMEIKCQDGLPGWLADAMAAIPPKRISKFTTSVDLLTEDLVSPNRGIGKLTDSDVIPPVSPRAGRVGAGGVGGVEQGGDDVLPPSSPRGGGDARGARGGNGSHPLDDRAWPGKPLVEGAPERTEETH